jgi:hypothetical protein
MLTGYTKRNPRRVSVRMKRVPSQPSTRRSPETDWLRLLSET